MNANKRVHLTPAISPDLRVSEAMTGDIAVEPYINKRVVARRMGRTIRSVDSLMKRGIIPFYKLGPSVFFRWSEIQSHLTQTCRVNRGH